MSIRWRPISICHIDVSYLNVSGTFYFLGSILDGYSRNIVQWDRGGHRDHLAAGKGAIPRGTAPNLNGSGSDLKLHDVTIRKEAPRLCFPGYGQIVSCGDTSNADLGGGPSWYFRSVLQVLLIHLVSGKGAYSR